MNEQLMNQIKELIELLKQHELKEINIKTDDLTLELKNSEISETRFSQSAQASPLLSCTAQDPVSDNFFYITSPLVGTFYRSPSPSSPRFAEVGEEIDARQTLCIIEAMKVMNEIVSEKKGRIVAFLVESGEMVDYGKELVKIELIEETAS